MSEVETIRLIEAIDVDLLGSKSPYEWVNEFGHIQLPLKDGRSIFVPFVVSDAVGEGGGPCYYDIDKSATVVSFLRGVMTMRVSRLKKGEDNG